MKKKKLLLEDATVLDVFKTGKSFFIFFFVFWGILMIGISLDLNYRYTLKLNGLRDNLSNAQNEIKYLQLENDCLKNNGTYKTIPLQGVPIAGVTFCSYKNFDYNISVKKVEQGIEIELVQTESFYNTSIVIEPVVSFNFSTSMINISSLNDTSITIKNRRNATSFDLNLTSNDSSNISIRDTINSKYSNTTIFGDDPHCPHLDDPTTQFDSCLNFYLINKNSVCFDKNTTLNFIPQNNLFQFVPSYNIENGNYERDIPIRDLSEIKYFCQDLNVTMKR